MPITLRRCRIHAPTPIFLQKTLKKCLIRADKVLHAALQSLSNKDAIYMLHPGRINQDDCGGMTA
jgi:hypothetical protein